MGITEHTRPLTLVFYGEKVLTSSNNNLNSMRMYLNNKISNRYKSLDLVEKEKLIDNSNDDDLKKSLLWDKFLILKNSSINKNFEEKKIISSSNSKIEKMLKSIVDIVK